MVGAARGHSAFSARSISSKCKLKLLLLSRILLHLLTAAHGTDRRTTLNEPNRRYRGSSRQSRGLAAGGQDWRK
jgi:hypothetical protein